jgi:hypothetical protein
MMKLLPSSLLLAGRSAQTDRPMGTVQLISYIEDVAQDRAAAGT